MVQIIILLAVSIYSSLLWRIDRYIVRAVKRAIRNFKDFRHTQIFETNFLEVKSFYVHLFRKVPSIGYMNSIDMEKILAYINAGMAGKVINSYSRNYYSWMNKRRECSVTIFVLKGQTMIEVGSEYVEILYDPCNSNYAFALMETFKSYPEPVKERAYEINIIIFTSSGLELRQIEIKPVTLDIGLYYNDDFVPIDKLVKERLAKENDKGIILLHGLPGTGKTTYIRHLVGTLGKKVLFVSPGVAGNLMNPEFIDLLIENPNSVLVIEDAENIIMDRKYNNNSSVSNLLNISDGLLSDCLNVQIICTFNSSLNVVDSALLRKGRLIAKYEFGKLSIEKAQRLSCHLGLETVIEKPMTLAEITNPADMEFTQPSVEVVGFRRAELLN